MDFGPFRETYFSTMFRRFFGPTFFEKMDLRRVLWPKCQLKKVSYIDPLVMRFSPKSEFLIGNFHQVFSFLVKPYFLFLQYRKSVLKKTQICGPLFERRGPSGRLRAAGASSGTDVVSILQSGAAFNPSPLVGPSFST